MNRRDTIKGFFASLGMGWLRPAPSLIYGDSLIDGVGRLRFSSTPRYDVIQRCVIPNLSSLKNGEKLLTEVKKYQDNINKNGVIFTTVIVDINGVREI